MPKLSDVQKKFLENATSQYRESLPGSPAEEYLASRGFQPGDTAVGKFRLGYVADPLPGHEMYRGMLAIPYLRRSPDGFWTVVTMRFRCIQPGCEHPTHGKYMSSPGDPPRLFNTLALIDNDDTIAITEGEIDAISATISGIPAVGVAGVETWKDHFTEPFLGYETVFVLADGDEPGMKFAHNLSKKLPNVKIIPMSPGEDVNSEFVKDGLESLKEKIA